jgi:hypothetical protein
MRIGKLKIAILLACCLVLAFEIWRLRSGTGQQQSPPSAQRHKAEFVLLPKSEVTVYAGLLGDPKPRMESWEPTVADIDDLNSSLPQISALSSKEPDASRHIDHPDQYFRQYLGVAVNGRKAIFVNAMCSVRPGEEWRKHLMLTSDEGTCSWHASYDPSAQKFSELMINGGAAGGVGSRE